MHCCHGLRQAISRKPVTRCFKGQVNPQSALSADEQQVIFLSYSVSSNTLGNLPMLPTPILLITYEYINSMICGRMVLHWDYQDFFFKKASLTNLHDL